MIALEILCCIGPSGTLPDDLLLETGLAEDRVHHKLQVVTGCGIAEQVGAACRLQEPAHFHDARSHVDKVAPRRVHASHDV